MGIMYLLQLGAPLPDFWSRLVQSTQDPASYRLCGVVNNHILFTSTIAEKFIRGDIRSVLGASRFVLLKIVDMQTIGNAKAAGFSEELLRLIVNTKLYVGFGENNI